MTKTRKTSYYIPEHGKIQAKRGKISEKKFIFKFWKKSFKIKILKRRNGSFTETGDRSSVKTNLNMDIFVTKTRKNQIWVLLRRKHVFYGQKKVSFFPQKKIQIKYRCYTYKTCQKMLTLSAYTIRHIVRQDLWWLRA